MRLHAWPHLRGTRFCSNSSYQVERFLQLVQREGARRGLYFNYDKCDHLRLNSANRISFDPLFVYHQLKTYICPLLSDAVKYLGLYLYPRSNNHKNVSTRISRAMEASKKLSPLLKHRLLPPNWKLLAYRSVVQSIDVCHGQGLPDEFYSSQSPASHF